MKTKQKTPLISTHKGKSKGALFKKAQEMNVYEGIMQGLQEAVDFNEGKIKARSNVISVEPVREFNADEIKSIRSELGMTQYLFAGFMGVSPKLLKRGNQAEIYRIVLQVEYSPC